ncbi:MAG: hypothetical protein KDA85_03965 [Planctomycetaceae bacterium]|nr:hypothetical protein [Planctomycetaceae bacterium]
MKLAASSPDPGNVGIDAAERGAAEVDAAWVSDIETQRLLDRLCSLDADVVFLPVRHHSPVCAALVTQFIEQARPAAVLIEGPSDFNESLDELLLPHQLPVAIYSYFRTATGTCGAYYPFCEYSPEWAAMQAARQQNAIIQLIDLPWSNVSRHDQTTHRYADAELRRGRYVHALCERIQVEDFDDLWDRMVECHRNIELPEYLRRVHTLCFQIRQAEANISAADRLREQFMAERIRECRRERDGLILVVTGGFHSSALAARLEGFICPGIEDTDVESAEEHAEIEELGIALTTYSYDRLDSLTGYNAGMPSPGFYEHAWQQRSAGVPFSHERLLVRLVEELRKRKQILSTADLIAVETSARALAALRGRTHVWRRDLIDAVMSALIKDELEYGCQSPFVDAVHAVLRGRRRGRLADGTRMPPLVEDIRKQLAQFELEVNRETRAIELNLLESTDVSKSRVLHRLRILGIVGFSRTGGTDFLTRKDLTKLRESWQIRWSPEYEGSCIEASRFGTSLLDAVGNRLLELARSHHRDAEAAAGLLVEAAQAGIAAVSSTLLSELNQLIHSESRFGSAAAALRHLLFLYCFDEAFGTTSLPEIGSAMREAFSRSLWLLELTGRASATEMVPGLQAMLETFRRERDQLEQSDVEFTAVLRRVEQNSANHPTTRGAAAGMLWTLGAADDSEILADLLSFSDPDEVGDFLTGLFALAREVAQRNPQLVMTIDRLLQEFGADEFQTALPSLRLAFTYFTPREKHYMLTTLFESLGLKEVRPLEKLSVSQDEAAEVLALEERLFEAIEQYGLGADDV